MVCRACSNRLADLPSSAKDESKLSLKPVKFFLVFVILYKKILEKYQRANYIGHGIEKKPKCPNGYCTYLSV